MPQERHQFIMQGIKAYREENFELAAKFFLCYHNFPILCFPVTPAETFISYDDIVHPLNRTHSGEFASGYYQSSRILDIHYHIRVKPQTFAQDHTYHVCFTDKPGVVFAFKSKTTF